MRRAVTTGVCLAFAAILGLGAQSRTGTLSIYYIDTEGGQSTLFVGPTGESLLVDTGNAGERDLGRIVETLRTAGVAKIDHLWTTHYHGDHVGALLEVAKQFPVGHFYDHGTPNAGDRIISAQFMSAYEALSSGKRTSVKPGDKVKMAGLDITTVAAANAFIRKNLPGGGGQNAACAATKPKDESTYPDADNGDSSGFVLTYGRFRTVDLGDLTWNGELDLMCPVNRIGTVDLYLTSHHGLEKSGSPALVQALQPRVVVNLPGICSVGAVRNQTSAEPVGWPKLNGATRRLTTVVRGTGRPIWCAIRRPNTLSPIIRLKRFGHWIGGGRPRPSCSAISQPSVCVCRQPRGFGCMLNSRRVYSGTARAGSKP